MVRVTVVLAGDQEGDTEDAQDKQQAERHTVGAEALQSPICSSGVARHALKLRQCPDGAIEASAAVGTRFVDMDPVRPVDVGGARIRGLSPKPRKGPEPFGRLPGSRIMLTI